VINIGTAHFITACFILSLQGSQSEGVTSKSGITIPVTGPPPLGPLEPPKLGYGKGIGFKLKLQFPSTLRTGIG
jgi:hypothetical protein